MNQNESKQIYIIGAGISGLIAALELENHGYSPVILEKSATIGGRVQTHVENEATLDIGFQVLLDAYPNAKKYLDFEKLNLERLNPGALVYKNGAMSLIGDPLRMPSYLLPTLLAKVGSLSDKIKIFRLSKYLKQKTIEEIFSSNETTTQQYLTEKEFSDKIIDSFFRPFFTGIFLEPNLSTSSRMFEFVYKMFSEGHATIPQNGIGEISAQLHSKLKRTQFQFKTEVKEITSNEILLKSSEKIPHSGVILATSNSPLHKKLADINWKSCHCFYFEINTTNIPEKTIALVADPDRLINNLYGTIDSKTGKQILSVTVVRDSALSLEEQKEKVQNEVRHYTHADNIQFIKHFSIPQALPDRMNLKYTATSEEIQVDENIYLAGDHLLNGSLNAAMESGRIAALAVVEKHGSFSNEQP